MKKKKKWWVLVKTKKCACMRSSYSETEKEKETLTDLYLVVLALVPSLEWRSPITTDPSGCINTPKKVHTQIYSLSLFSLLSLSLFLSLLTNQ